MSVPHLQPRPPRRRAAMSRASRSGRAAVSAGTVSVRAVATVIDVGVAAGISRTVLLNAANARDEDLRDPDARLPVAAAIAVWQALARHIPDAGFGVTAGAALHLRQLGLLGYVACFSPTLRDALQRIAKYGRLVTEEIEFTLCESKPEGTLAVKRLAPGDEPSLSQDYVVAAALQVSRELTGVEIVPIDVRFTYRQPSSSLAHRRHFRCPLRFGQAGAAITFRARDLGLRVVRADATLAGYLSEYADIVLATLTRGETARHAVRAAIWSVLGDGKPSLDRVAGALRLSPRTLQRRLAEEGTSLHRETEEIRKTMAMAMVRERAYSIDDVAFLLGYSEPSAFFRSFRRWTGTTPRQFRTASR